MLFFLTFCLISAKCLFTLPTRYSGKDKSYSFHIYISFHTKFCYCCLSIFAFFFLTFCLISASYFFNLPRGYSGRTNHILFSFTFLSTPNLYIVVYQSILFLFKILPDFCQVLFYSAKVIFLPDKSYYFFICISFHTKFVYSNLSIYAFSF